MGKIKDTLDGQHNRQCSFRHILLNLDEDDNISVNNAIQKGLSGYVIANALKDGGYDIAASTVARHINGKCRCK